MNGDAGLETNPEARTWGMLCHLAALSVYVTGVGHILGPLIVWLIKKDTMPFVDDQGKESINFQITLTLAYIVCVPLIFVVIGIFLMAAIGVAGLILVILAAVAANRGERYRYPFAIRFLK